MERICRHIEQLRMELVSTAAERVRLFQVEGLDEDEAAVEALSEVDLERRKLWNRLGLDEDGRLTKQVRLLAADLDLGERCARGASEAA
jgi:uncharacterized protein (DUF2384 family)